MKITSKFDDSGIRNFQKKLEATVETQSVPIDQLLTDEYIAAHTKFASVHAMMEAAGVKEDELPNDHWNEFVKTNSDFDGWQAMLLDAYGKWVARSLSS